MPSLVYAPSIRFSSTVSSGKRCRPSGTRLRPLATFSCGFSIVTSWPLNTIFPFQGLTIPIMLLSVVVLPAPLGPRTTTMLLSGTFRFTPQSTCISPYPLSRSSTLRTSGAVIWPHLPGRLLRLWGASAPLPAVLLPALFPGASPLLSQHTWLLLSSRALLGSPPLSHTPS